MARSRIMVCPVAVDFVQLVTLNPSSSVVLSVELNLRTLHKTAYITTQVTARNSRLLQRRNHISIFLRKCIFSFSIELWGELN